MAGSDDQSEKTEDPTQRKLDDARDKGQVAASREINHWFMILAGTLFVLAFAPSLMRDMTVLMLAFIERPETFVLAPGSMNGLFTELLGGLAGIFALPVALFVVAAALSGLVQHGFLFSPESITPKLEKISLAKGFKRLFSAKSLMEFLKGLLKLVIVGTVATVLLVPAFDTIELTAGLDMGSLLLRLRDLSLRLMAGVLSVMTLIAVADLLFQRFQHTKSLRMSRQDMKEEYKQTEGDPIVKQRLRQIRMERSRRRMMAAVPTADVVVTNPTHFAVALAYDQSSMAAPRVVAKGADAVAHRIRDVAREHAVPVIENPPLARALYATVEIDQEVPAEHYKAVAEIIGYVWKLKGRS